MDNALALRTDIETIVPVDPKTYFACTRRERQFAARELAKFRVLRARAIERSTAILTKYANLLKAQSDFGLVLPAETVDHFRAEIKPWLAIAHAQTPTKLLACAYCGHLTTKCTCVDGQGNPLDYGFSQTADGA